MSHRIPRTGRHFAVTDPSRLAELADSASRPPGRALLLAVEQASAAHHLPPPLLQTDLGARCHLIAMTTLVDKLAGLIVDADRRVQDEKAA